MKFRRSALRPRKQLAKGLRYNKERRGGQFVAGQPARGLPSSTGGVGGPEASDPG